METAHIFLKVRNGGRFGLGCLDRIDGAVSALLMPASPAFSYPQKIRCVAFAAVPISFSMGELRGRAGVGGNRHLNVNGDVHFE